MLIKKLILNEGEYNMQKNKLNLKKFVIMDYGESSYLFISDTAALFEIDNSLKSAIDKEKNILNIDKLENMEAVIKMLDKAGLIKESFKEPNVFDNMKRQKESALVLMLAQNCNLCCSYCFAEDGEYSNKGFMNKDTAKKAIDYIFNTSKDKIGLILFGGEPLLNKEVFRYCIEYSKIRAKETEKGISYSITTNATLLDEENSKLIRDNKFTVTISIDGDKETHNRNRFDSNGLGTYDIVVKNINKYLGSTNLSARATLTKYNTNIKEIYEHLLSLGFKSIHISPATGYMDKDAYQELEISFFELIKEIKKRLDKKEYEYCIRMSNIYSYLQRIHYGGVRRKFCGAYNNMITIDIDGRAYGCHRFLSGMPYYGETHDELVINQAKKNEYMKNTIQEDFSPCSNCWIIGLCGGGCIAENYDATGNFLEPHKLTCEYMKHIMYAVIKLYIGLSEEQKNVLFYEKEVNC